MKKESQTTPKDNSFIVVEKKGEQTTREIFYVSEADTAAVSERPILIGAFLAHIENEPGVILPFHKGRADRLYLDCANSNYSPLTEDESQHVEEWLKVFLESYPQAEMLRHALPS